MRSERRKRIRRKKLIRRRIILILGLIFAFILVRKNFGKTDQPPKIKDDQVDQIVEDLEDLDEDLEDLEEELDRKVSIAIAGDLMFHMSQVNSAYNSATNSYDFSFFFPLVESYFKDADLAIANLETTLAGERLPYQGYPTFNTPDSAIDAIKNAGIDLVTTTNNHSFDTGLEGLQRTAKTLEEHNLDYIGTYYEPPSSRIKIKEINGIKIAILAYTEMLNMSVSNEILDKSINMMDKDAIKKDVEEAKANEADLILALMHWGVEYSHEPSSNQRDYAEFMAEEGVDIIVGSHPHVIQAGETIGPNDTFVFYSTGNFISNQRRETLGDHLKATENGMIVQIEIEKKKEDMKASITNVDYISTWVYRDAGNEGKYDYKIVPTKAFIEDLNGIASQNPHIPLDRVKEAHEATKSLVE